MPSSHMGLELPPRGGGVERVIFKQLLIAGAILVNQIDGGVNEVLSVLIMAKK